MIGQVKYGEGGHQALGVRARGGSIWESVQRGSLCRAWRLHVERVTGMMLGVRPAGAAGQMVMLLNEQEI